MLTPRKPNASYKIIVANETSYNGGWENPFAKDNPFNENQKFILYIDKNSNYFEESTNEQDLDYYKENYLKYELIQIQIIQGNNETIIFPICCHNYDPTNNNYIIIDTTQINPGEEIGELQKTINRFNDYINDRLYRVYLEETIDGQSEIIDSFGALYRDECLLDFIETNYKQYAPYTIVQESL